MTGASAPTRHGTSPRGLPDLRLLSADLALVATALAVAGLFAISPVTLEAAGIAYMTSGGSLLSKVHPSTLLAAIALILRCLAGRRPLHTAWRLATSDTGVTLMLAAFAVTALDATLIAHTPMTPLIDTFVLPVLVYLLLRDLNPIVLRWMALLVGLVICANGVIAVSELLRHFHLVSIDVPAGASSDPTRGDVTFDWRAQLALDWRATALLGHPLVNGLVTGALIICLAARGSDWIPAKVRYPVMCLQGIALLVAFGARTALVLTIAFSLMLGFEQYLHSLRDGARLDPRKLVLLLIGAIVVIGIAILVYESGYADNTLDRFQNDEGSATTRITMFALFTPLSPSEMLFGPDPDLVATWQRLEGLEFGIESSWVGLALSYGLVVTGILVTGLAAFVRSILKTAGPGAAIVLIYFFILVSVAASMSTKSTIFALTIVLIQTFLQKDVRWRPDRSQTRVGLA